jgi:hypothetical protein
MSVQWSTTLRDALLDEFEVTIGTSAIVIMYSGAQPANCATAASGTVLATVDLDSDWMGAASAGSKAMIKSAATVTTSNPYDVTASAAGTIGYYRIYASDGTTCHEQGTVTITGSGGDMTVDNTSLQAGQHFQLTGYQKNAAGA